MAKATPYQHIKTLAELKEYCQSIAGVEYIGFDTEFVSESTYLPELCLIQVATEKGYAIIDTLAVGDLTDFWQMLSSGNHVTIAHAAREEFLFCFRTAQAWPKNLFDTQLAAGMVGDDYPLSYGNLVHQAIGVTVDKGETRTDWRRRPLTKSQLEYALQDVVHLKPVYDSLCKRLKARSRMDWMEAEMRDWQSSLEKTVTEPQWRRVSGIARLKPRELAIVRGLWIWRAAEAERKNRPAKRILPDDLIVELSKRGTSSPDKIKAIRGFGNRVAKHHVNGISAAIKDALSAGEAEYPRRINSQKSINLGLLGQFLTTALNVLCRTERIAPALVGTAQEVRDVAAIRMGLIKRSAVAPRLLTGWRAEVVGQLIDQVVEGRIAIRVGNPKSDNPLVMERIIPDANEN